MPAGDGTGPMGMGPRTGRVVGYCAGYDVPGYSNPIRSRGFWGGGRGFSGRGRGHRHWYHATGLPFWARHAAYGNLPFAAPYTPNVTPEQEVHYLKDQAEYLATSLEEIQKRIDDLGQKAK